MSINGIFFPVSTFVSLIPELLSIAILFSLSTVFGTSTILIEDRRKDTIEKRSNSKPSCTRKLIKTEEPLIKEPKQLEESG